MRNKLANNIKRLIEEWPAYHSTVKVDSTNPTEKIISTEIPNLFKELTNNEVNYIFVGSSGKGNLSAAPWFATFHKDITESAQDGFYVVTLFSLDLKRVILEIGFGAFQFERRYGNNKAQKDALRNAAKTYQATIDLKIHDICNADFVARLSREKADLKAGKNKRYMGYENGAIYHIEYEISELPNSTFEVDYREFINLYNWMAHSSLIPHVDEVSWEGAETPEVAPQENLESFIPQTRKRKNKTSQSKPSSYKRYSKQAKAIGDTGEEYAFQFEKLRLSNLGRKDLAEQVIWEAKEGATPGWDISSFEENGLERFIEVKSTDGDILSSLILTSNEWEKAISLKNKYWIYLVTNARKNPKIQTIQNPVRFVENNQMMLSVNSWELQLFTYEDN